jgi:hypothetical protein
VPLLTDMADFEDSDYDEEFDEDYYEDLPATRQQCLEQISHLEEDIQENNTNKRNLLKEIETQPGPATEDQDELLWFIEDAGRRMDEHMENLKRLLSKDEWQGEKEK